MKGHSVLAMLLQVVGNMTELFDIDLDMFKGA